MAVRTDTLFTPAPAEGTGVFIYLSCIYETAYFLVPKKCWNREIRKKKKKKTCDVPYNPLEAQSLHL